MNKLKAFEVEVQGKALDYRVGNPVDLTRVRKYLEKTYTVTSLRNAGRHVVGILSQNNQDLFFKLATSEGISAVTENEYAWNDTYNAIVPRETSEFWVPRNVSDGRFDSSLYYFITDFFDGTLLVDGPKAGLSTDSLRASLPDILRYSEHISSLRIKGQDDPIDYRERFITKTHSWFDAIPEDVRTHYEVSDLLDMVHTGIDTVVSAPRHGDFTPWHIIKLANDKWGLIDGEHYLRQGVGYYDIGYFIERVFTVLKEPKIADELFSMLVKRNYALVPLRVVLSARGIGSYLDASLEPTPDYASRQSFQQWLKEIFSIVR